jgi:hypothetical protein
MEKAWPLIPVKHPGPICSATRVRPGQEYGLAPASWIGWRRIGSTGTGLGFRRISPCSPGEQAQITVK